MVRTEIRENRIVIDDEMTIFTAADLKSIFVERLSGNGDVELDLSKVSEMDTTGFQLLLLLDRELKKRQKNLHIRGVSEKVRAVFALYRKEEVLGLAIDD